MSSFDTIQTNFSYVYDKIVKMTSKTTAQALQYIKITLEMINFQLVDQDFSVEQLAHLKDWLKACSRAIMDVEISGTNVCIKLILLDSHFGRRSELKFTYTLLQPGHPAGLPAPALRPVHLRPERQHRHPRRAVQGPLPPRGQKLLPPHSRAAERGEPPRDLRRGSEGRPDRLLQRRRAAEAQALSCACIVDGLRLRGRELARAGVLLREGRAPAKPPQLRGGASGATRRRARPCDGAPAEQIVISAIQKNLIKLPHLNFNDGLPRNPNPRAGRPRAGPGRRRETLFGEGSGYDEGAVGKPAPLHQPAARERRGNEELRVEPEGAPGSGGAAAEPPAGNREADERGAGKDEAEQGEPASDGAERNKGAPAAAARPAGTSKQAEAGALRP